MQIARTIAEMRQIRRNLAEPVGFVPTMGYLHEGHLSLVKQARQECKSVVASIFVNPTQFGPGEDFTTYPRDTEHDLAMLEPYTDAVFMPEPAEMYPEGADSWVEVGTITEKLEGASRPGHFRGVTTVVAKLFNIVQADIAYFGQKDAQQAAVIRKMVADLDMPLEISVLPTVREADGLAMSSRNSYLDAEQRQAATVLYKSLMLAKERQAAGETDAAIIHRRMTEMIEKEPLAKIDYISIADANTLEELDTLKTPALISMAVKVGRTRLIDNIVLG